MPAPASLAMRDAQRGRGTKALAWLAYPASDAAGVETPEHSFGGPVSSLVWASNW